MEATTDFCTFIEQVAAEGGYPTDDVLRVILPLFEKVQAIHEAGKVAPFGWDYPVICRRARGPWIPGR